MGSRRSNAVRIAHLTATFPPYQGGTGNVAFHNARCLADLGHEVTVYTATAPRAPRTEKNGFGVRRLRTPFRIGNAPLLPELLALERHDIVHLHYPFIFGAEMVLALRHLRRQPYVLTYHNDLVSPGFKGGLFWLYQRVWATRLMKAAARVIITAHESAAASPIIGPLLEEQPEHFREVPNGVDTGRFRPGIDGGPIRERLGIRGAWDRMVLFVGSMDSAHHPKTGVPVLLRAISRLRDPTIFVVLVGGGDRIDDYAALAARLGMEQHTRFMGRVPNEELPAIYAAADVVVQPSLLFEPFGLVAVEAMACGTPVVVSDLPGVRRVVVDAGGGLTSRAGDADDVADKIRSLLADPALRARLGAAGRAGVEAHYDWSRIGPQLVETYEEALGRS